MTSHPLPSDSDPPTGESDFGRPATAWPEKLGSALLDFVRSTLLTFRRNAETRQIGARGPAPRRPTGLWAGLRPSASTNLFQPREIEYARLQSLPPSDSDLLILTDLRIMRVRTDAEGAVVQLSQAALRQVVIARAEDNHGHACVGIEFHVGSSMRLERTTPAEARRFITAVTEVVDRLRT
ncbi:MULTISPECIES: hypothetical protein [unclassified Brevibacterium]|uniref:hypothetical protein n=1 Tax=unclassified Brevibacterium TaxID=2614124 RepID=UPI001E4318A5|nr:MULTISPECIES: hypothetical protein [unclassified Brevibacterium]MCD1287718.1 hypothetical protein [Brevibacterium sp. CCUG 69071]MDK8433321.1 hypothetical protein [Brevibacterium sp. H-BE7]